MEKKPCLTTFLPSVKTLTKNRTWENLYWELHPWFLRSKKGSFLSTGSFFQTLGKFDQQTFKKSLTKNAAQASQKESVI